MENEYIHFPANNMSVKKRVPNALALTVLVVVFIAMAAWKFMFPEVNSNQYMGVNAFFDHTTPPPK